MESSINIPGSQLRDFTMAKYDELCRTLLKNGYLPMTVTEYLRGNSASGISTGQKRVIIRHDVDRKIQNALKMAELEHTLNIRSTYYFRYPSTFKPEIIAAIHTMGHEVGYHYETLCKTHGDYQKAIVLFKKELAAFREIPGCDSSITTICMHGSPLSRYDNRDLWKRYEFKDFEILGEAYISMAGKGLKYLTDTGRTWAEKHSLRDSMPGNGEIADEEEDGVNIIEVPVETTDDLTLLIKSSGVEKLYLAVHPERWALDERQRVLSFWSDKFRVIGKLLMWHIRLKSTSFRLRI